MNYYLRRQVAKIANIHPETIRYYETSGLIKNIVRSDNGYRLYPETVLSQLEFIRNAKESGFTLKEIKEMFDIAETKATGFSYFSDLIDKKMGSLDEMKKALVSLKNDEKRAINCPHIRAFMNNFKSE
ncbi:MerR family transcriptional regulator [Clostridium akagii]|uniref:MerR family transcriptional regulator n=1 Tax=Clostridium akagii TaxID=91623 RepID=UPI00069187D3|nr:MerR family transcriptional regulator [Clostridium akagii]